MTQPKASRGSHRKAVHHTALRFPSPINYPIQSLVSVLSWIGFLASAVSEYGFEVDFPLTPPVWLAVALCVMFATLGHAVVSNRLHGVEKREFGTNLSGDAPLLSHFAGSKCADNKLPRTSDESPNLYQPDLTITGGYHGQMSAGGVLVTPSDAIPAVIFLSPVAPRGPPADRNHIDCPPGRPARPFCTVQLSSKNRLPSRSPLNIKSPMGVPA